VHLEFHDPYPQYIGRSHFRYSVRFLIMHGLRIVNSVHILQVYICNRQTRQVCISQTDVTLQQEGKRTKTSPQRRVKKREKRKRTACNANNEMRKVNTTMTMHIETMRRRTMSAHPPNNLSLVISEENKTLPPSPTPRRTTRIQPCRPRHHHRIHR
jgi:hypothetical protein